MTHTPGPWELDAIGSDGTWECYAAPDSQGEGGQFICECLADGIRKGFADESLANARLIAAAPNLLEVAKLLVVFNEGNPHPEDEDSWAMFAHGLMDKCRAAIGKAEGAPVAQDHERPVT